MPVFVLVRLVFYEMFKYFKFYPTFRQLRIIHPSQIARRFAWKLQRRVLHFADVIDELQVLLFCLFSFALFIQRKSYLEQARFDIRFGAHNALPHVFS